MGAKDQVLGSGWCTIPVTSPNSAHLGSAVQASAGPAAGDTAEPSNLWQSGWGYLNEQLAL